MVANTTFGDVRDEIFAWDIDNSMWSSFNTPYAYTVYKWVTVILFLTVFQVIFMLAAPIVMILFFIPNIYFWINDIRVKLNKGYTKFGPDVDLKFFISMGKVVSFIWHGHEMVGWENIPDGPAIYYLYHGPMSLDGGYIYCKIQGAQKRKLCAIGHKKRSYNLGRIHKAMNYCSPLAKLVIGRLKNGWQIYVAIGRIRRSKVSDNNYRVHIPHNRKGIAHIVKSITDVKIPIVPIFTRNIQEAFWIPWFLKPLLKILPKNLRAYVTAVGGLPVKLTSFIGEEIEYDTTMSAEEIMERLRNGMQTHIDKYQIVPGNRLRALRERFHGSRILSNISVV
uniref:Phospholipid/glycerol acyltransferase domain-containing protein n=1 Tax=Strigamia maritima TaxID=126957 RepID=T1J0T0_STRMM